MAKKWPEKVVQRSFIKELSFPISLYFVKINLIGETGGTVGVAIVGPASIYNVKVDLIGELVELLEGEGRGHSVLK